jgi:hyperosmotically inducible protein
MTIDQWRAASVDFQRVCHLANQTKRKENLMNIKRAIAASASILALTASTVAIPVSAVNNADRSVEPRVGQLSPEARDAWLDGKLEATLLFNEHLNSFDIDTDVRNGVAYLSGAVESDIDRDLAGEIAQSINGINSVENSLVVDRTNVHEAVHTEASKERASFRQSVSDATLTSRVKTQLLLNRNTGGLDIDVDSSDSRVTLSGDVKTDQERELAVAIARNTSGAKSVTDNLHIARK